SSVRRARRRIRRAGRVRQGSPGSTGRRPGGRGLGPGAARGRDAGTAAVVRAAQGVHPLERLSNVRSVRLQADLKKVRLKPDTTEYARTRKRYSETSGPGASYSQSNNSSA